MKQLITLAVIATFVFACGNANENKASSDDASASTATATAGPDGEKIYKQYCVTCHGLYGDMGASGAFNLQKSQLTMEQRIDVITNGRPNTAMVAWKDILKEDQIKAVAQYVETLRK